MRVSYVLQGRLCKSPSVLWVRLHSAQSQGFGQSVHTELFVSLASSWFFFKHVQNLNQLRFCGNPITLGQILFRKIPVLAWTPRCMSMTVGTNRCIEMQRKKVVASRDLAVSIHMSESSLIRTAACKPTSLFTICHSFSHSMQANTGVVTSSKLRQSASILLLFVISESLT